MDQNAAAPQGQDTKIYHAPCAFNPKGVSKETCERTTRVLNRNQQGCCGNERVAPCASKLRACIACLRHSGLEPGRVSDVKSGLCDWHRTNGAGKERPRVADSPASLHGKNQEGSDSVAPATTQKASVPDGQAPIKQTSEQKARAPSPAFPVPSAKIPSSGVAHKVLEGEVIPPPKDVMEGTEERPEWQRIFDKISRAMAEAEYVKIEPRRIRPMPGQPRTYFDETDLDELANSVADVGQIQPGIIRAIPSNDFEEGIDFEILDGERRWRAVNRAQVGFYKAMLVRIDDEAAPFVIAAIANFNRANHTHVEISDAIEKMHNGMGMPIKVIAKKFNMSEHWAYQLHGLQNLHPRFRGMLDPRLKKSERLPLTAGIDISKVDQKLQHKLVERFQRGEITLKGLRKEAVAVSREAGAYIRQREADEPARKLKKMSRLAGAVLRELSDLKLLVEEEGMRRLIHSNPQSASKTLSTLKRVDEMLTECRYKIAHAASPQD